MEDDSVVQCHLSFCVLLCVCMHVCAYVCVCLVSVHSFINAEGIAVVHA